MSFKIPGFSSVLLFSSFVSFSQTKQYLYYFDKDLNSIERAKSIFNGIGIYENGILELKVYYSLNKNLVSIEHYTDSSLQLNHGSYQSYYPNASKEWKGNYSKGKQDGLWQKWDSLGHMIDSSVYNNGEKIIETHFGYYKNGILDSFIVNDITTGRLQKTFYDDKGRVVSEVAFAGQAGLDKVYNNGILVRADSVFTRDQTEASFPGGASAWNRYIMSRIERNQNKLGNNDYGTCIIKFIIDIDGKVTNVEATTMQGTNLAEIAVDAIRTGPRWKPAMQYGRVVRAYRLQPVSVTQPH